MEDTQPQHPDQGIESERELVIRKQGSELVERPLRELRWESGLPIGKRIALKIAPTEARQRLDVPGRYAEDIDKHQSKMRTIGQHPGDAWNYHKITIRAQEKADDPYYG